jgi:hypothetical protein
MIQDVLYLSKRGEELVLQLRDEAIEHEVICMQAPVIWDAETIEDSHTAKAGCNGTKRTKDSDGSPPCPLRALCLETALEIGANYGVWGGLSVYERRQLKQKRLATKRANRY